MGELLLMTKVLGEEGSTTETNSSRVISSMRDIFLESIGFHVISARIDVTASCKLSVVRFSTRVHLPTPPRFQTAFTGSQNLLASVLDRILLRSQNLRSWYASLNTTNRNSSSSYLDVSSLSNFPSTLSISIIYNTMIFLSCFDPRRRIITAHCWTCARGVRSSWEPLRCVCDPWPFAHTRTPCAATRCSAGQGPVGGRAGPLGCGGIRGILLGHRPGRSRTLPRATCKLVPTAKILPRARHSCVGYPTTASPTLQARLTRIRSGWSR